MGVVKVDGLFLGSLRVSRAVVPILSTRDFEIGLDCGRQRTVCDR